MIEPSRWCDRTLILTPIFYCLVLTEDAYYEECQRFGVARADWGAWMHTPTSHATTTYLDAHDGEKLAIVSMQGHEKRTPIQVAGLLVHEAVHLVQRYCERVGEHQPGAEFQAYATQRISQELMEQYVAQTAAARLAATQPEKTVKPKMTEKADMKSDKKAGLKEGSKKDMAKDAKMGMKPGAKKANPFAKK